MFLYQWNDALLVLDILLPHHCVRLASACLTVGKDADVVSFKGVEQHFFSNIFVNLHLRGVIDILRLRKNIKDLVNGTGPAQKNPLLNSNVGVLWLSSRSYRGVRPVGVIKVEALDIFGLFGVADS